ncbi:nuclear body protein SP140-like protein [Lampris incognitus]|uniref:nuclear body protein SP140-like protein n=1 Tax=Lampris incognitus TaxID=2546036 RepID=UPI0024B56892|nr:nuclear body protein SP140-like protein [Lampris incognitus]
MTIYRGAVSALMDLEWLDDTELQQFFHCKKTELSCMEKPCTFLRQLRDHDLITEDRYKRIIRMKSKENIKNGMYDSLDWLEKERPKHIRRFWLCIFQDIILNQYPDLKLLRNSLIDGSFPFFKTLPSGVEKEDTNDRKRKKPPTDEDQQDKRQTTRKGKTPRTGRVCGEEEEEEEEGELNPTSQMTRGNKKRARKPVFSSPMKKGEKQEIWTWPIYKTQLPVNCGDQQGFLVRERLAKGEKCIQAKRTWFTPWEFEEFAGKNWKNWKRSIHCAGTPLGQLIKLGHLECAGYNHRKRRKAIRSLFPSSQTEGSVTGGEDEDEDEDEDEENGRDSEEQASTREKDSTGESTHSDEEVEEEKGEEEETEPIPGSSHVSRGKTVFNVTCGAKAGILHKTRFASGTRGKSVRTEASWMNPEEFVREGSSESDPSWKRDIQWEGKPLNVLIEAKVLQIHSMLCKCKLCSQDPKVQEDQRNDDDCFICRRDGGVDVLVECDRCPRSFHQRCHLPNIDDTVKQSKQEWICTFCIFKTSQGWRNADQRTKHTALSREVSAHLLECQYLLLSLYNADEDQIFATNPTLTVRGYADHIRTPMWLEKVAEKLHEKSYQTVGQFASDVQLIFTNCIDFNRDNEEFSAMGVKLKELFEREFNSVFCIQQESE